MYEQNFIDFRPSNTVKSEVVFIFENLQCQTILYTYLDVLTVDLKIGIELNFFF